MIFKIKISLAKIISISRKLSFVVILLTTSLNVSAEPYKSFVRFADGDVVSASVLNDLIDRIELSLKEISRDEMVGTWTATQYWCANANNDPTVDATTLVSASCNGTVEPQLTTGAVNSDGGVAIKRIDTATITTVTGSDTLFDIAFSATNMFYNDASGDTHNSMNVPKTHKCTVVAEGAFLACALDSSIVDTNNAGRLSSYFNVQRLSSTRLKLFWGPWRGGGLFNVIILDKKVLPPIAPTSVGLTVASSSIDVAWTAGDSVTTSYDVHRKTTATGTFASVGTASTVSYSDSDVTAGGTYWYRVFAKNTDGTSVGSSVVKVTYNP
jgi:hypothetical protein